MLENNTPDRRQEAQTALGGDKLAEREANVEKRRKEAMLAMEGDKHKTRREVEELKVRAEAEEIKKRAEERATAAANHAAAVAKSTAERAAAETAAIEAEAAQREKIAQADATTEQIKQSDNPKLRSFRTIKTDMAKAVREQGLSLSKIAAMQGRSAGPRTTEQINDGGGQGGLLVSIITVLLIAGGLGAWWWYGQTPNTGNITTPVVVPSNPILRADTRRPLELNNFRTLSETYEALDTATSIAEEPRVVGLIEIYLTRGGEELSFANLRQTLSLTVPDNLTRHLRDNFLFGVYDSGESRSRFLILQTSFFDQAWSAAFDWERYMVGDLSTLLRMPNDNRVVWSDRVIRNKDVREAKNEAGETVLIYSFINDQTILIARNENTFVEVYRRLIEQV